MNSYFSMVKLGATVKDKTYTYDEMMNMNEESFQQLLSDFHEENEKENPSGMQKIGSTIMLLLMNQVCLERRIRQIEEKNSCNE